MGHPVDFPTLEALTTHPWVGNAYADGPALLAADAFIHDASRPLAERAEAARSVQDRALGCGRGEGFTDEEMVTPECPDCGHWPRPTGPCPGCGRREG